MNPSQNGERVALRERIAEACREANTGLFGNGHCDDWYELADAVLDAFGWEQVVTRSGSWWMDDVAPHQHANEVCEFGARGCVPLYTVRLSARPTEEGTDAG